MTRFFYPLWLFILLFSISAVYSNPAVEKILASKMQENVQLSILDYNLNKIYRFLKEMIPEAQRKKLLEQQRAWLKTRNTIIQKSDQELMDFYKKRVEEIKLQLIGVYKNTLGKVMSGKSFCKSEEGLKALAHCTLPICRAYKAYFTYDKNPEEADKILKQIPADYWTVSVGSSIHAHIQQRAVDKDLLVLSVAYLASSSPSQTLPQEDFSFLGRPGGIPFWLLQAHPQILEEVYRHSYRWHPTVINPLDDWEFKNLDLLRDCLGTMEALWTEGTIRIDIAHAQSFSWECLIFTPGQQKQMSIEEGLFPLKTWSFLGIWNYKMYQKFLHLFKNAAAELKTFYENVPEFKMYAKKTPELLAFRVSHYNLSPPAQSRAFQDLADVENLTLDTAKSLIEDSSKINYSHDDLSEALNICILKHAPQNVIAYLLHKGANPNALVYDESALMKAVDQPDILTFLLKNGATVDTENSFGKTALFYAIQLGSLETVKILIEAGANINHPLKSKKELKQLQESNEPGATNYYFMYIGGFTPLAYALHYCPGQCVDYLKSKGATIGEVSEETVRDWIKYSG